MESKYTPYNPVIDDFSEALDDGVVNATKYGEFLGKLGKGKDNKFTITDSQMRPALYTGDVATIKPCRLDEIKVGNLVFYRLGSQMVVRRVIRTVIKVGETTLVTKADSSNKADRPVRASQVVGKVVKLTRDGRNMAVPNYANFWEKLTCYGTIPFHQVLLRGILSFIPFVHLKDDV